MAQLYNVEASGVNFRQDFRQKAFITRYLPQALLPVECPPSHQH